MIGGVLTNLFTKKVSIFLHVCYSGDNLVAVKNTPDWMRSFYALVGGFCIYCDHKEEVER